MKLTCGRLQNAKSVKKVGNIIVDYYYYIKSCNVIIRNKRDAKKYKHLTISEKEIFQKQICAILDEIKRKHYLKIGVLAGLGGTLML